MTDGEASREKDNCSLDCGQSLLGVLQLWPKLNPHSKATFISNRSELLLMLKFVEYIGPMTLQTN